MGCLLRVLCGVRGLFRAWGFQGVWVFRCGGLISSLLGLRRALRVLRIAGPYSSDCLKEVAISGLGLQASNIQYSLSYTVFF